MNKVSLEEIFFHHFVFPLSTSFHQCSILIFIYMLLLPEGQAGEAWEPPKSITCPKSGSIGYKRSFNFFVLKGLVVFKK
jgi:hypothetical protein